MGVAASTSEIALLLRETTPDPPSPDSRFFEVSPLLRIVHPHRKASVVQEGPILQTVYVRSGFSENQTPAGGELIYYQELDSPANRDGKMAFPLLREQMLLMSKKLLQ